MSAHDDYWQELVSEALESAGLEATPEQVNSIAKDMRIGHECYGQVFGLDVASANLRAAEDREKRDLQRQLGDERRKITCRQCGGVGRMVEGGPRVTVGQCWKCNGEGRHLP